MCLGLSGVVFRVEVFREGRESSGACGCCALAFAHPVSAQQSVDYASVSGRVTDPSGAVVPGAQSPPGTHRTNVTGTTVTDQEGRFRFPYLRVGTVRDRPCSQQGFQDTTRQLTLTVGAAFELPVSLASAAWTPASR